MYYQEPSVTQQRTEETKEWHLVEETLKERYLWQRPSQDIQVSVYPQTCIVA